MIRLLEIAKNINEADRYGSKSIGKEDGDTWDTAKGRAGKYNGEIRYFDGDNADDAADEYAKTGKVDGEAGGADKKDTKVKGKAVSDFGRAADDNAESDDVEISDANSGPIDRDDIMDMLKNDSEIMDKIGTGDDDDLYWDGMDLVSSKMDDQTVASIPDDANMTLGDLKKQIMDYEKEKFDPKSDGPYQGGSHFDRNDMEVESSSELDDFVDEYKEKLNDEQRKKLEDIRKKIEAAEEEYKDDPGSLRDEITQYWGEIEKIADMTRFETITINGQKYKPIKEGKKKSNPRILKEIYDRTFRSLK